MTIERDFEKLAKELGFSVQVLKRLLGDTSLRAKANAALPTSLHIGLRLLGALESKSTLSDIRIQALRDAIVEMQKSCPHVYRWIVNGAFDPSKIPDDVTRARLQHASRTCGRLRARFLRSCG